MLQEALQVKANSKQDLCLPMLTLPSIESAENLLQLEAS